MKRRYVAMANGIAERHHGLIAGNQYIVEPSNNGNNSVYNLHGMYITESRMDAFDDYESLERVEVNTKMILGIQQRGSGWGGYVGAYVVDPVEQKLYKLPDSWSFKDKAFEELLKTGEYADRAEGVMEFKHDISLLEQMLPGCEVERLPIAMDQQFDMVLIVNKSGKVEIPYATDLYFVQPSNIALQGKIKKLVEAVQNTFVK